MEIMKGMKICIDLNDSAFEAVLIRKLSLVCSNAVFYMGKSVDEEFDLIIKDTDSHKDNEVLLVTDLSKCDLEKAPYTIYKYMEASEMIKALYFIFFQLTGIKLEIPSSSPSKVIAIAAYGGGFGATSISLGLSATLSQAYGEKILYVNLSYLNDSLLYLGNYDNKEISKLTYYLKYKESFSLEPFICSEVDYDYLNLPLNNYYSNLNISALINKALEFRDYTAIICDIGCNYNIHTIKLIEMCDCLVMVDSARRSLPDKYKTNILEGLNYRREGLLQVKNMVTEEEVAEDILVISMDEETFVRGEKREIKLHRNYGVELMKIAGVIEEKIYNE